MNPSSPADRDQLSAFELCFQSLVDTGRAYALPCDARGHVDMDGVGERARRTVLFARSVVGREVAMPKVQPCVAS